MERAVIKIKGMVQGVGFRPYVYNLAGSMKLSGFVKNTSEGVLIDVEGKEVAGFIGRLKEGAPPLSEIREVDISPMPAAGYSGFRILKSEEGGSFTHVPPDVSVCDDCLAELFDPSDRRHLYPFINCTNCGPRYSITKAVPYDRENTTMSVFAMCPECSAEYSEPRSRRFHAEPNACPRCGPALLLDSGRPAGGEPPIAEVIRLLKEGAVVALKGLGGFHLACDALNEGALRRLRAGKRKSRKPFALMAPSLEEIRRFCMVSEYEEAALLSRERPIVLLRRKGNCPDISPHVASGTRRLGFMLPYTPLHYLIFYHPLSGAKTPHFSALVMTSGNLSEEPISAENEEAKERLGLISDAFLLHNRDIFTRVDDSVLMMEKDTGGRVPIRQGRGYAPVAIALEGEGPEVIGAGADIKNTFTLTKGSSAIVSQHIGDMENYETLRFFQETLDRLKTLYRARPAAVAYDLHPSYHSSAWAKRQEGLITMGIQHHYAHAASVMAEHGLKGRVIGVIFDGSGYGTDGTLWGGEFLIADTGGFQRAGHLRPVPLPGGQSAVKEPWRTAVSYIRDMAGEEAWEYVSDIGFRERYGEDAIRDVLKIAGIRELSPVSSGAGRLFDAVSAILGICDENTYEGEAPTALEAEAHEGIDDDYPLNIKAGRVVEVDFSFTLLGIIKDMKNGLGRGAISAKFHNTVSECIVRAVRRLSSTSGVRDIVLSGGSFQNAYLLSKTMRGLGRLNVFVNREVPANDAGVSLGQAYILRERLKA